MTVRELIKELLNCNLDADVTIEVKSDQDRLYTVVDKFHVFDYNVSGVVIEEVTD